MLQKERLIWFSLCIIGSDMNSEKKLQKKINKQNLFHLDWLWVISGVAPLCPSTALCVSNVLPSTCCPITTQSVPLGQTNPSLIQNRTTRIAIRSGIQSSWIPPLPSLTWISYCWCRNKRISLIHIFGCLANLFMFGSIVTYLSVGLCRKMDSILYWKILESSNLSAFSMP